MSLAKLYRQKVLKPSEVAKAGLQARQAAKDGGSHAAGGTFITQNPNEMGVNVANSYETSKLTVLEQKQREVLLSYAYCYLCGICQGIIQN